MNPHETVPSPSCKTSGYWSKTMESHVSVPATLFSRLILSISAVFAVIGKSQKADANGNGSRLNKVRRNSGDSGNSSTSHNIGSPPITRANEKPTQDLTANSGPPSIFVSKTINHDPVASKNIIKILTNDLKTKNHENEALRSVLGNIKELFQEIGMDVMKEEFINELDFALREKDDANESYRNLVMKYNELKNEMIAYKRAFGDPVGDSISTGSRDELCSQLKLEKILQDILQAIVDDKEQMSRELKAELQQERINRQNTIDCLKSQNQELNKALKHREQDNRMFRDSISKKTEDLQYLTAQYGAKCGELKLHMSECESKTKDLDNKLKKTSEECTTLTQLNKDLLDTIEIKKLQIENLEREGQYTDKVKTFATKLGMAGSLYSYGSPKNGDFYSEYMRPESAGKKDTSSSFDMLPLSEFNPMEKVNFNYESKNYAESKAGKTESDVCDIRLQMFKCANCYTILNDESKYRKHKAICLND